jgi:hypothetical protein
MVEVRADLNTVTVTCDGRVVAVHDRCWATAQTITDPVHVSTAARLRQVFNNPAPAAQELTRDLAEYDTAFGVAISTVTSDGQVA